MKQTQFISRILYYLCLILCGGYFAVFLYSGICLLTGFATGLRTDHHNLHINYPFTEASFLTIENNIPYIIFSFLAVLLAYGIFFMLAAKVFRVFFREKLFTEHNISHLRRFYIYNIFFPLPLVFLAGCFTEVEKVIWGVVLIHFMLGIFCLFLANIFRQGLHLQNEQDLFI